MNKSADKTSTASLPKMKTDVVSIQKIEGQTKNETTIHNDSHRNIFLIPISCTSDENPQSQGAINNLKAKMIPANDKITVRSSDYDLNTRGCKSQIYILFRAGDADNKEKFLQELGKKQRAGVTLEGGEMFLLHSALSNRNLRLKCLEGRVTGDGSARQDKEGEKDKQSNRNPELNSLSAELQGLKTKIKALQNEMELLKSLFKSFAEGRTSADMMKCCDPLRANLDPTFSINTRPSSK